MNFLPRYLQIWAWISAFGVILASCTGSISGSEGPSPYDDGVELQPGAEFKCNAGFADPGPREARRLTVSEYASSVQATLGVDIADEAQATLPADVRADGFTNSSGALIVTLEHVEAFGQLAQLAVSGLDVVAFVQSRAGCSTLSDDCARAIIDRIGTRILRAPPTSEETAALLALWTAAGTENATFEEAAGLLIEAMLQAPRFVYRLEPKEGSGLVREADGHEMASRLSYLIWGSAPDKELLVEAVAGRLRSDEEIESQVRRMLADPRARDAFNRFVSDWLHLSRLDNLTRDEDLYPQWSLDIGQAMKEETLTFAEALVWDDARPLLELFSDQRTFAERALAEHYGFPDPSDGMQMYDLSTVPERGGLLTQGSVLTIGGNEASMVARGQFLLENVMCGKLGSPPPGVDTTPPEVIEGRSQRFYSETRVNDPACGGCHSQMEPLAWGLERFDGAGSVATTDRFGNDLREDGNIRVPGQVESLPFSTIGEMMGLLSGSTRLQDCMSLKAAQFAVGRLLLDSDGCSLVEMRDRFIATDGSYQELIVAIALSPMVRTVRTR